MKEYKVIYTETIVHEFYVKADSIDDVGREFDRMGMECELDFSDGDLVETTREVFDEELNEYVEF